MRDGRINGWTHASGDEVERWGIGRINVVMRYPKRGIDDEERPGEREGGGNRRGEGEGEDVEERILRRSRWYSWRI